MTASAERRERTLAQLRPYIEAARTFSGWSFGDVRVTHLEPRPSWDYEALVREHASRATSVIDLGTGGAEFYSRMAAELPPGVRIVATEEWHVNAPIARDALAPLGGSVVRASAERALPFRGESFDLVIDRHEALVPAEVVRVLTPGGTLITQQVGHGNWREIDAFFGRRGWFGDHFNIYQDEMREAGCEVTAMQHAWKVAYGSLGDLVYMLLVAPWEVPDFDPEREIDALIAIQDALGTARGIELTFARYLIVARKPGHARSLQ